MARQNNQVRYRMKPIHRIKIREERFATPDNRSLMIRARFKQAVIKILTKLQAFHIYEKIKRNKHCVIPVNKFVKDYHPIKNNGQDQFGGVSKHNETGMKGVSVVNSEESEEVFDDEIQSSSEGSLGEEDDIKSARIGSEYQSGVESANNNAENTIKKSKDEYGNTVVNIDGKREISEEDSFDYGQE